MIPIRIPPTYDARDAVFPLQSIMDFTTSMSRRSMYVIARLLLAFTLAACAVIYIVSIWDPELFGSSGETLWPYLFIPWAIGAILSVLVVNPRPWRKPDADGRARLVLMMYRHPVRANLMVFPLMITFFVAGVMVFAAHLGGDVNPIFNGQSYQLVSNGSAQIISKSTFHHDLRADYLLCSSLLAVLCAVALVGGWVRGEDEEPTGKAVDGF